MLGLLPCLHHQVVALPLAALSLQESAESLLTGALTCKHMCRASRGLQDVSLPQEAGCKAAGGQDSCQLCYLQLTSRQGSLPARDAGYAS